MALSVAQAQWLRVQRLKASDQRTGYLMAVRSVGLACSTHTAHTSERPQVAAEQPVARPSARLELQDDVRLTSLHEQRDAVAHRALR